MAQFGTPSARFISGEVRAAASKAVKQIAGPERLQNFPVKTKALWVLMAVGWLAAAQSWAGNTQLNHDALPDEQGEQPSRADSSGTIGRPEPWNPVSSPEDFISQSWASLDGHPSLDLDRYGPGSAVAVSTGVPQARSLAAERDAARRSDIVSSLILVGLGGVLLIYLRWSVAHSPHPDPAPNPAVHSAGR
jgi:hypothetical protein